MFLEVNGLTKYFGGLAAIKNFDVDVNLGEIVGLIGPNGAGKSTFFNLVTKVFPPTKGQIIFNGVNITNKKTHEIAKLGISRTFQLNPLFSDFTVWENVIASFYLHPKSSMIDTYFNTALYRHNEAYIMEQSLKILKMVGLDSAKYELARNIPHGYQKMLGIARALAVKPKLLLLDEPIAGMNPDEIEFTLKAIKKTHEQGVTIVLVEHNMRIMEFCDRVVVINFGEKIAEGPPKEIKGNKEVIRAYFGGEHAA